MFVEPRALEILEWQLHSPTERKGIDGQLNVGVFLFPRVGLVVEDMQEAVADLQKINMTSNEVSIEVEIEASRVKVHDVFSSEIDRNLDGHSHRIIHQHEVLQCLVALLIGWRCGQGESCQAGRLIFLADYGRIELRRKL